MMPIAPISTPRFRKIQAWPTVDRRTLCRTSWTPRRTQMCGDPKVAPLRLSSSLGVVNQEQIGMHGGSKSNRLSFAEIQLAGHAFKVVGADWNDAQPRRRIGNPPLDRRWRSGRAQFTCDGWWHDNLPVESTKQLSLLEKNEVV